MAFEWYESDDATAAGTAYSLTTTAGTASAAIELHAWLNKGSSVGTAETRHLRVYVLDSGTYKTSGLDTLDRREFEVRIIGSQNPDLVPGFSAPTTAWTSIGTRKTFALPAIYPNCCVEIEVRINPGYEGGASSPVTFYIKAVQGTGDVPISIPTEVSVDGTLDMGGERITGLGLFYTDTDAADAASVGSLRGAPVKFPARLVATAPVTWPNVVTNGDFATVLTPWTGTNWAQSAGTALHTAGATDALAYAATIVDAVTYRITVTVTGAAGTVTPMVGADAGTAIAAGAGAVTQEILSTAGGALSVSFVPTTDFDGALDDILVETLFYGLPDDIDTTAVADTNRVLLTAETDTATNGKWIVSTGAWTRHPDSLDSYYVYSGVTVWVTDGAAELKSEWVQHGTFAAQAWAKKYQVP